MRQLGVLAATLYGVVISDLGIVMNYVLTGKIEVRQLDSPKVFHKSIGETID